MQVMEAIGKIRQAYLVHGEPLKLICRELLVSWKVVRKVLRSGTTSLAYKWKIQPLPKFGLWKGDLERLLTTSADPTTT